MVNATLIFEALDYIDNLRLHGKNLADACAHAWHRYGIETATLLRYIAGEERLRAS